MPAATHADFSGLWIPLVTPFRRGEVDHHALAALTRSLSSAGIQGLVVCGSTGESASLDDEEQLECLRTVATHTPLPVVMGVGGHHLGTCSIACADCPSSLAGNFRACMPSSWRHRITCALRNLACAGGSKSWPTPAICR